MTSVEFVPCPTCGGAGVPTPGVSTPDLCSACNGSGEARMVSVTVEYRDALAVAIGGLDYAIAVTEGKASPGASPMRLRRALMAALDAEDRSVALPPNQQSGC